MESAQLPVTSHRCSTVSAPIAEAPRTALLESQVKAAIERLMHDGKADRATRLDEPEQALTSRARAGCAPSRSQCLDQQEHTVRYAARHTAADHGGLPGYAAEAREVSDTLQQMIELSPQATFLLQQGRVVLSNQAGARLLGWPGADSLLGRRTHDFIDTNDEDLFDLGPAASPWTASEAGFIEQTWHRRDGTPIVVELAAARVQHRARPAIQIIARDITQRKRNDVLQQAQNRILNMIAAHCPLPDILAAIASVGEDQASGGLCAIRELECNGTILCRQVAPSLPSTFVAAQARLPVGLTHGSCSAAAFLGEAVVATDIARDSLWTAQREPALTTGLRACSSWPIFGRDGAILGTLALYFRERTAPRPYDQQVVRTCTRLAALAIESCAAQERMRRLAHYDELTGLPNRFLFSEYLNLALHHAKRQRRKFAVLFLDLDKFKEINDTLGHLAGDRVLQVVASRLRASLRTTDKIARIGGDEFYILIEELTDLSGVADIAEKLLVAASSPVEFEGRQCVVSASIGVSIYPDDGMDETALIGNADGAMYDAKHRGRNGYRFHGRKTPDARSRESSPIGYARIESGAPDRVPPAHRDK